MNPWPWGIVLGAALAVATTLLVEYVKFKWNESRTKRLFRTLLQIELPLILTTVDTLIKEHDKQNYFWLLTVALVPVQRQGFDRRRDQIVLFKDDQFRADVVDFYQRLGMVAVQVEGAERLLLSQPDQKDFVEKTRVKLVGELRDVHGRGRSLLQRLPEAK